MELLRLFLIGSLAASTLVAGQPSSAGSGHYSVQQVRNPSFTRRDHRAALLHVYNKHRIPLPAALRKRADTGSVTNQPIQNDAEWLTPVQVGTPPKTFQMDFDTGSSDFWNYGNQAAIPGGQNVYDETKSSSSKVLDGSTFSISYGDGSAAAGHVAQDKVSIGGLEVDKQAVEVADQVTDSFSQQKDLDGLVGLAFSSINTVKPQKQSTFFANANAQHGVGLFTADLQHNAPGKYNFGFVDKKAFTGDIAFTPVNSSTGLWTITSTGFSIGNSSQVTQTPLTGIVDTGTTLLLMPDAVTQAYYSQVQGAQLDQQEGGFVFPCDASLPDFNFNIGNKAIRIPGSFINFTSVTPQPDASSSGGGLQKRRRKHRGRKGKGEGAQAQPQPQATPQAQSPGDAADAVAPVDKAGQTCFGGLQSSQDAGINIFGDIAIKSAFVVFDGANSQVGFASKPLPGA